MWQIQKTTNLLTRLIVILVFVAQFLDTAFALSDKRLCADENCRDIISLGRGVINYIAGEEGMVSFKINAPIRIKSKSAGKDPSLWGVEINGREGYVPHKLIKETKIYISEKNLKYEVDVVKPGSQTVLTTSENVVGHGNALDELTTTTTTPTTKPLDMIPMESNEEPIVTNPVENASSENPAVATPVLMEMVDGTQIPLIDDNADGVVEDSNEGEKINQSEDDDDDEIGDYDDDEEDLDNSEEEIQRNSSEIKTNEIKDTTHNNSESNDKPSQLNEIKTNETKDSTNGINETEFFSNQISESNNEPSLEIKTDGAKDSNHQINKTEIVSDQMPESNDKPPQPSEIKTNETKDPEIFSNQISQSHDKQELDMNSKPTESLTQSDIQNEETQTIEILDTKTTKNLLPSDVLNDATNNGKNKIESEKIDLSLPRNDLPHTAQKELHTNLQSEQQNTVDETEQPINDTLQVPADLISTTTLESQQQVPMEPSHILKENTENDNTKEALIPVSGQENNINDNISTIESLPHNKAIEEDNLSLHNQASLTNEEKLVNHSSQEQYHNTEKPSEQNDPETTKMQRNQESSISPKPAAQTEGKLDREIDTETLPNLSENQIFPQATTEALSNPEIEMPQTSTASPINLPSSILESQPYQYTSTETPPSLPDAILPNDPYQQQIDNSNPIPYNPYDDTPSNTPLPLLHNDPYQYNELHNEPYQQYTSTETPPSLPAAVLPNDPYQQQIDNANPTPYNPYDDAPSNTPLPPQYDNVNRESLPSLTPTSSSPSLPTTEIPQYDYYEQQTTGYAPSDYVKHEVVTENPIDSHHDQSSVGYGSIEPLEIVTTPEPPKSVEDGPKALPSLTTPFNEDIDAKENKGLFATIMGTVNNMLSSNRKAKHEEHNEKEDLQKILYPSGDAGHTTKIEGNNNIQYCEKLGPNGNCPHTEPKVDDCDCSFTKSIFNADLTFDSFAQALASKILEISELLAFLAIVAAASIFFIFGYYCFCNSSREGALLSKLNQLESSLLATHKENAILKHNLMSTRQKLASIEDNSFGSNDMVVSLKAELEEELVEKARLQEQITNLQKELENAADAGIELNKIVSELLSNQTGDESIISSVEELQKQLNEQQHTILEINSSLAEKSRENSELQLLIAEQNARYESEIANLQRDNDELEQEKGNLQTRLEEARSDFDKDLTVALEGKNFEIKRLQNEIVELSTKLETEHTKWQTSMAKVEALGECLKNVKRDPSVNITQAIDVANIRAELLDAQKKYTTVKERLEIQLDSRKLAENQLQIVSAEVERLKQDFNQSEKDKLEAQTRLEVLSNYFKDKENQLQKELSLKEAMWLKQQGETTTTVDRLTAMKEEIQSLKSQNDSLRAEIEAQVAAHKAQTGTLENRAHETWLAARQSDRRYDEARAEATALRRRLTALAAGNVNEANKPPAGSAGLGDELTNAPSPIHMESPGSPMLGRMPPPPFLPPPFMGPPPPFMGLPPPPPFVPPGEMRPAPLGRIMSPPPQRSGRFTPPHLDYEDYLDYEGNNTWHRHTYSPPPRTYRSLSPADSRYNYETEHDLISKYDTETDFSPPPSPRESRRRGGAAGNGSERGSNNTRSPYNNSKKSNSANKGALSSGSDKSYNSSSHHQGGKSKSGNTGVGKSFV